MVSVFAQLATASAASGWVDTSPYGVVSVKDQNAVGDGVTDDTTAILRARDVAGVGGTVYFPPGTYVVGGLILNVAGQTWVLHPNATLYQKNAANTTVLQISANGVTVTGGTVDGNGTNQTVGGRAISADNKTGVTIRDMVIQNTFGVGVWLIRMSSTKCLNLDISNTGQEGIYVQVTSAVTLHDITIDNCTIDRTAISPATASLGSGVRIRAWDVNTPITGLIFTNNRVYVPELPVDVAALAVEIWWCPGAIVTGNKTTGGQMGLSIVANDYCMVSGNVISKFDDYGIEFAGNRWASCSNNVIYGYDDGISSGDGIGATGTGSSRHSDYSTFSGNSIYGTFGAAIRCGWVGQVVSGNMLYQNRGNVLYCSSGDGLVVTGNVVDGVSAALKGIFLDSCKNTAISGNTVRNFTNNGVYLYSAQAAFVVDKISITGNTFHNTTNPLSGAVSNGASYGTSIVTSSNGGMTTAGDYITYATNVREVWGTGTPEAVLTAGIGSIFHRTDGGAATSLYIKESGTGNTGWVGK